MVLDAVIEGDTVREVLNYVQFHAKTLLDSFRQDAETALREGRVDFDELARLMKFYEEGLNGYTYLE